MIQCKDCGGKIVYQAGEPESYDSAGYTSSVECEDCEKEIERPTDFICTIEDLEVTPKQLYRATEAGLPMLYIDNGVVISAYAEGYDFELPSVEIEYPFWMADFYKVVKALDELSSKVWDLANAPDEKDLDANYETISGLVFDFSDSGI